MLQQTQVERVIPKYRSFIRTFPSFTKLAQSSLSEVLIAWQGLGYNRRARMLHQCARMVVDRYAGQLPRTHDELMKFPGIGHYTAGAVMAFAFSKGVPIIETNIRTVYLHHFFQKRKSVSDKEILEVVSKTVQYEQSREWYYALMDYGSFLKKTIGNVNSRSVHHVKQKPFKDSDRQIRGGIIRILTKRSCSKSYLVETLDFGESRIEVQLQRLLVEGMISQKRNHYHLGTL